MKWLAFIVFLVMLAVSAGFRKFAGVIVLVGAVGGILIWQYQVYEENQSRKNILPAEVTLEDVSLSTLNENYKLTGRLFNHSEKHNLSGVQLKLTVSDCAIGERNNCVIIKEADEYIYIDIPSQQARDFKKNIFLYSDIDIKGKLNLGYIVDYAETK